MNITLKTSRKQISKNIALLVGKVDRALVYGCGRYVDHIKTELGDKVAKWAWFDPNVEGLNTRPKTKFECVILDNVLNVLDSDAGIITTLLGAWDSVAVDGWLYIAIYEGDTSGNHCFNGKVCQRNEAIETYEQYFWWLGKSCEVHPHKGGYALHKVELVDLDLN